jgi:hypothetical protein
MKQLIITLGILCLCLNSKLTASNYFTQSNTPNTTIEHQLDAVDQLLFNSYTEQELKLTPQQIQKLSTQQRITILGRFFRWIGEFFEPVWGKYREPHRRTQGPYMVFQYSDISDLRANVNTIRNRILDTAYNYDNLYYEIFKIAKDGLTANCIDKDDVCPNSNVAKCAAFVYIIGLNFVNQDTITYFNPFTNATIRDSYRSKAETILMFTLTCSQCVEKQII